MKLKMAFAALACASAMLAVSPASAAPVGAASQIIKADAAKLSLVDEIRHRRYYNRGYNRGYNRYAYRQSYRYRPRYYSYQPYYSPYYSSYYSPYYYGGGYGYYGRNYYRRGGVSFGFSF